MTEIRSGLRRMWLMGHLRTDNVDVELLFTHSELLEEERR